MTQKITQPESQDPFKKRGFKSIKQSVTTSLNEVRTGMLGNRRVYPTKWDRLNVNLLGGLQPGKMYVIAGRPGVGKSAFSNQMVFDLLDVSELLSVQKKLTDSDYEKYKEEVIKYNDYPIYFNNVPRDMEFIKEANVEICNKRPDATVINVFDHSRLILSNKDQELQKLNDISKGCMWMQSKMGTISILLSQLNRNIEQEHRAKAQYQPLLTDLFGGDSIGQDAHVVMMLQRPNDLYGITDIYCNEDPIKLLACHIEKNRDGLLGMIPYEAEMSTFTINERIKTK